MGIMGLNMRRRNSRPSHIITLNNNPLVRRLRCIRRVPQHPKLRTQLGMFLPLLDTPPPYNTISRRRLDQQPRRV